MWNLHTRECYSDMKRSTDTCYDTDETQKHYAKLKGRHKSSDIVRYLNEIFRLGKSIETKSKLVLARG